MEVKPGYKQTEVGVIPEDWSCERIGGATANRTNAIVGGPFGSDLVSADYVLHGVPVIRGQNMAGRTVAGEFAFVSPEKAKKLRANLAHSRDLVFTQRGTLGQVSIVPDDTFESFLVSQSQMKLSLDEARHDPSFVRQYFASEPGQKQILTSAIQTGVPHTNLGILRNYRFPAPPLPEQRAIATALSDVDALLGGLERLIAKKRDLKQAAMQRLLTGETRLPGFHGEWEMKRLGEVVDTDPENLSNNTEPEFRFKYIAVDDVDRGVLRGYSEQRFASAPSRARRILRLDDVLVSTVRPNLQSHLLFREVGSNWVCSTGFCVVRCHQRVTQPGYIFFQLFANGVSRQIEALLTGSNYPAINSGDVRALEIPVPEFPEQAAIAEVLSDIDAELAALEARRDKTRDLKQAMMQELLTGKTRLVPAGAAHG
jgi:type I restriction enzyme S subunit